jgi:hypothetical protein
MNKHPLIILSAILAVVVVLSAGYVIATQSSHVLPATTNDVLPDGTVRVDGNGFSLAAPQAWTLKMYDGIAPLSDGSHLVASHDPMTADADKLEFTVFFYEKSSGYTLDGITQTYATGYSPNDPAQIDDIDVEGLIGKRIRTGTTDANNVETRSLMYVMDVGDRVYAMIAQTPGGDIADTSLNQAETIMQSFDTR